MTAEPRVAERRITAFMEDPDAPRPENPIHSTSGGTEYGYRAALVGGVTVYGWTAPAIIPLRSPPTATASGWRSGFRATI